ncbi:tetratricopeptide repeat protein [Sphingobacterium sp. LRF_L2]|uniref:tetratricopeptide repeat protein n=1 Tax=Sphingobacterium sp. LRF_L2 TaxID=3369421 RepID=UPI003F6038CD
MHLHQEYKKKLLVYSAENYNGYSTLPDFWSMNEWFDGLALFETQIGQENASRIYRGLFDNGVDFPANLYLDDSDYAFFVSKSRELLARYGEKDHEAWIELALQHILCRRDYIDKEKALFFLKKAILAEVPAAKALFYYYNNLGLLNELNREEAKAELKMLADRGDLWAIAYFSHLEVWTDQFEDVYEKIQVLKHSEDNKIERHYYESLQFYYARRQERDLQVKVLEEGVRKTDSKYCKFVLTEIKRYDSLPGDNLTTLIPAYLETFEYGITDAAVQIALIKLAEISTDVATKADYDDVIFYLTKAWEYNNNYAGYRLACLYLYTDIIRDIDSGLTLLQQLKAVDHIDAQVELAEIYLEGHLVDRDENMALFLLRHLAETEVPYAQFRLGNCYEYGLTNLDVDYLEAFSWYKRAAQAKLPQAIYQVGRFIKYGIHGENADLSGAIPYFEEAAGLNFPAAITELGLASEMQSPPDYAQAFVHFSRAADLGYPYANYLKGIYLEFDYHQSGQKKTEEAFSCYKYGAHNQDLNSMYELARCYRFGIGTAGNIDEAIALYRQAAERNHVQALTDMALCYEYGYGVGQDVYQAQEFIRKAVDLGYPYAYYVLGRYYLDGLVTQDSTQALQLLQEAVQKKVPEAMLLLADYYFFDYDQQGEYDKAFSYYEEAFKAGYITDGIGMCYEFGIGVTADALQAFKCYRDGAEKGNMGAIYRLARCFYFGIGAEIDKEQAFRYFDESGQHGNIYAKYFAGLQLLQGDGIAADLERAIEWIKEAAEADYPEAQFRLANCFLMGEGVFENEEMALGWFERAADNGHEGALKVTKRGKR